MSGSAGQPRRLALLALLDAGRGQPVRRDKLIATLWPEATAERARHSLANTVYSWNRDLGPVIETVGDGLRLDPARLASDVAEFEAALARGDLKHAAGLYCGPFLDGFFIKGTEEFEEWSRAERDRLEHAYGEVLGSLAERAAGKGHRAEAVKWLRRLASLRPHDAAPRLALMRTLAESGDRGGALAEADAYAFLMRKEFDAEPDPPVLELAARIRTGEPFGERPDWSRPFLRLDRRAPRLWVGGAVLAAVLTFVVIVVARRTAPVDVRAADTAPPAIAVMPFRTSAAGIEIWREGIIDLLTTNLDGAGGLRAIDERTVLAQWNLRVPEGTYPDSRTALEVARRTGARYAVIGEASDLGGELRFSAEVYDVATGQRLGSAVSRAPVDSLYTLVDDLSMQILRSALNDAGVPPLAGNLAALTTTSLPALRAYLEGEAARRRADLPGAADAFRRAVAADTTFSLAWFALSDALSGQVDVDVDSMDAAADAAVRHSGRLRERDRVLVLVSRSFLRGRVDDVRLLEETARRYPNDYAVWELLAAFYYRHMETLLMDEDLAMKPWERAQMLDPASPGAFGQPMQWALLRDDSTGFYRLYRHFERIAKTPRGRVGYHLAARLAWGTQDDRRNALAALDTFAAPPIALCCLYHPRFLEIAEEAAQRSPSTADSYEAIRITAHRGKISTIAGRSMDPTYPVGRATFWLYVAYLAGVEEQTVELDAVLMRALGGDEPGPALLYAAARAIDRGDQAEATALRERARTAMDLAFARADTADATFHRTLVTGIDGYMAWKEGDRRRAWQLLDAARLDTTGLFWGSTGPPHIMRWWTARILVEMGRSEDAERYYRSLLHLMDPYPLYELARLHELMGERAEAGEEYELVAIAWKDGDPPLRVRSVEAGRAAARLR